MLGSSRPDTSLVQSGGLVGMLVQDEVNLVNLILSRQIKSSRTLGLVCIHLGLLDLN